MGYLDPLGELHEVWHTAWFAANHQSLPMKAVNARYSQVRGLSDKLERRAPLMICSAADEPKNMFIEFHRDD